MRDPETVRLAIRLAERRGRFAAARELARHVGATTLLAFVDDPDVDALVPAPGFPQTLPGGPAWRDLLERARTPGRHTGRVAYPAADTPAEAIACADAGLVLIFMGGASAPPSPEALDSVMVLAPLLAAAFRAEHAAAAARGEVEAARTHAREVEALAKALDAARSEVERTVLQLERESRAAEQARAHAEAAARAKDEFLAMLGHELRNPLSPIVTALQLMRLKNQTSREQDVIERQVAGLMRLVDDLLDVSRITQGKIELRKERVELAEVAARGIEMASPIFEKKQQVLAIDIPPRGLLLEADPGRLAQVFSNLLTNAAKYSDPDSRIVFAAERDGGQVRVHVKDQGIGIAPEMLGAVFDMFVQHRQSLDRSQGGLGLGLAIARSLAEMHGGTVTAHSEGVGRGSEFVVTLPTAEAGEAAAVARPSLEEPVGTSDRSLRVLVVDDNDDAATLMAEALDSLGYVVRAVPDGPSALELAAEFKPHLALLDIGLPVMDGYELAERLRRQAASADLRLVAVTGYGQHEDRQRSRRAGFDAHLVKPVGLAQLREVLQELRHAGEVRRDSGA